jgi:cyclase
MKSRLTFAAAALLSILFACIAYAQELSPNIKTIKEGIYVYVGNNFNSNCGIVVTQEGLVLIDSGHNPTDSLRILDAVKKISPLPIRFLIDTEPHPDHTTGHFVFSPPATVIAHVGATDSMINREKETPGRIEKLAVVSPEMRKAVEGYRFVPPQIEYRQKMILNLGERTFELLYLKGVHSEADTAVWLPRERVLFSASAIVVDQFNILRPFVTIPDILAASKMMKALNPEVVVPGHGTPGTVKIFDDTEKYYALLVERVGKMVKEGKSLDEIKKEIKMPEYDHWATKERFPTNVEAAYKVVQGN